MTRRAILKNARRFVLKVGSRVLTAKGRTLSQSVFDRLAREVSSAKKCGYEPVLVSSGAIAAGMGRLSMTEKPKTMPQKQAAAAIGQSALMWNYERAFSFFGEKVAQVLLTRDDLSNRNRYLNARNTLLTLLEFRCIPIINENDTVVVQEIKFGDNDNLSALVTNLVNADLLIILSDIDGLYDRDPRLHKNARLIPRVDHVTPEMEKKATGTLSPISIGGMVTKAPGRPEGGSFRGSYDPGQRPERGSSGAGPARRRGGNAVRLRDQQADQPEALDRLHAGTGGENHRGRGSQKGHPAEREKPPSLRGASERKGNSAVGDSVVLLDPAGKCVRQGIGQLWILRDLQDPGAERPRKSKAASGTNTTMKSSTATIWSALPRIAEGGVGKGKGRNHGTQPRNSRDRAKGAGNIPDPGESSDGRQKRGAYRAWPTTLLEAGPSFEKGQLPRCRRGPQGAVFRRP